MLLFLIIIFSLIGSILAISLAGIFLLFPSQVREKIIPCLIAYATGILLSVSFVGIIPEALENFNNINSVFFTILIGIILFFLLEKLIVWRHCHNSECELHSSHGIIILIGDAFHNFIDGVMITAAFFSSISLGVMVSISTILHEIPQEVGDFAILLDSGYSRTKAFIYNFLSGLSTLLGAILSYFALENLYKLLPFIMAISAASLIYIALVDLSPELHRKIGFKETIRQILLIFLGIITIILFKKFLHHTIPH